MSALTDLQTAYNNVASQLASITANPAPSYSVQGVSISAAEYIAMLTERLDKIQEQIVIQGGPYQLISQGIS